MYRAERQFVTIASEQMLVLETLWGASPLPVSQGKSTSQTLPALQAIKDEAIRVEARGVFRAASLCVDIYGRVQASESAKLRGSLAGLKCLIFQYAQGLCEIDPAFKDSITKLRQTPDRISNNNDAEIETICSQGRHAIAAFNLKPLLQFSKNNAHRKALESLIAFPKQQKIQERPPKSKQVKFENLMRPISNLILSEARNCEKQVSISYASNFEELELRTADYIQECLETLCLNIVLAGIGNANTQISVTGRRTERTYVFTVNWMGYSVEESVKTNTHFKNMHNDLTGQGGEINFGPANTAHLVRQSLDIKFSRRRRTEALQNRNLNVPSRHDKAIAIGATR